MMETRDKAQEQQQQQQEEEGNTSGDGRSSRRRKRGREIKETSSQAVRQSGSRTRTRSQTKPNPAPHSRLRLDPVPATDEHGVPHRVHLAPPGVEEIGEEVVDVGRGQGGVRVGEREGLFFAPESGTLA
jgi:hypothetical protein